MLFPGLNWSSVEETAAGHSGRVNTAPKDNGTARYPELATPLGKAFEPEEGHCFVQTICLIRSDFHSECLFPFWQMPI